MTATPVPFGGRPESMTLGEAREWLLARVDDGDRCPLCTQFAKVYRRQITGAMSRALILMWHHRDKDGWAHLPSLPDVKGGDDAKARYWGLIEPMPDVIREDGSNRVGWWRLTEDGVAFVHGTASVRKYAHLYDGRLQRLSGPLVTIRETIGTRFDYGDLMAGR